MTDQPDQIKVDRSNPIKRLRQLLANADARSGQYDWNTSSHLYPIAPYGTRSDPVAAWVNFRDDLRRVLDMLEDKLP